MDAEETSGIVEVLQTICFVSMSTSWNSIREKAAHCLQVVVLISSSVPVYCETKIAGTIGAHRWTMSWAASHAIGGAT